MKKSPSLKARGFSIGTKFILITITIQMLSLIFGLYFASDILNESRIKRYRELLFSQSDLIAREVVIHKDHPILSVSKLELSPFVAFQIVDLDGKVVWDSKNNARIGSQILGGHHLFMTARRSALKRGSIDYSPSQTEERFIGTYRKALDQYLILGAVSILKIEYDVRETLERLVMYCLLFCGFSFIAIVIFTHQLIKPIHSLTHAAKKISKGDFQINLPSTFRDEIGELTDSFAIMAHRIRVLLQGEIKKNQIEKEVTLAAELQQHLLPPPEIKTPRFEIQSFYQSASETGGDYWGYIETENHLLLYVGDATGHGIPSAMLTATARGCFSALQFHYRHHPEYTPTPSQFLQYANQAVLDISQGDLQMTLFAAVYSFKDRTLCFSNAGHNPAWIIRNHLEQPDIEALLSRGPRLGENKNFTPAPEQTILLNSGDLIFLYSDGLVNSKNESNQEIGKTKIKEVLIKEFIKQKSLRELSDELRQTVFEHHSGNLPDDDITFSLVGFR